MNRLARKTLATLLILRNNIKTIRDALTEIENRLDELHDEIISEIQKERGEA